MCIEPAEGRRGCVCRLNGSSINGDDDVLMPSCQQCCCSLPGYFIMVGYAVGISMMRPSAMFEVHLSLTFVEGQRHIFKKSIMTNYFRVGNVSLGLPPSVTRERKRNLLASQAEGGMFDARFFASTCREMTTASRE